LVETSGVRTVRFVMFVSVKRRVRSSYARRALWHRGICAAPRLLGRSRRVCKVRSLPWRRGSGYRPVGPLILASVSAAG
jgi:hypothetical protein